MGGSREPVVTVSGLFSIGGKESAHDRVDEQARVGTVKDYMRGELSLAGRVQVPADVTVCVCGARLTATSIANHAGVMHGHVKSVSSMEAKGGARVRC